MAGNRLSPSRRQEDIRAWWAEHLAAQRRSGETQAACCRAQVLDPKHFTLWKGKLRDAEMVGPPAAHGAGGGCAYHGATRARDAGKADLLVGRVTAPFPG